MTISVCVYDNKDDYYDGLYCNEYTFDSSNPDDYSDFLNFISMCLKKGKYIVLFCEEREKK